ncbi:MAG: LysE family translocator [Gammaproteobacteria bacterium]|nr:LysE family translocator [Gammaproteobacteria bacterium]
MIDPDVAVTFFFASVLLGLAPGPDNLFVLTQSAIHGRRAGFVVVLGLCTGLLVHTTAVALGVAALIQASSHAFTLLKLAGAGYLLWLAWKAFRASGESIELAEGRSLTLPQLYRRGIFMNVTNPKVSIFFLAFLPQFVTISDIPAVWQIVILGALFIVATLLVFGMISWLAGSLGERLGRSQAAQRILNRVAGTVFLLLAARLLVSARG